MVDTTMLLEEPKSKEIPLTRGYVAIVDAEDYERLAVYSWCAIVDTVRNRTVYARGRVYRGRMFLHRLVLRLDAWQPGAPEVDHINGNGLDNRKANLRVVSPRENKLHCRMRRSNTSGFRGVYWHKRSSKWQAQIGVRGRMRYLGDFGTAREAAIAYDEAAVKHNGAFAQLNFPPEKVDA